MAIFLRRKPQKRARFDEPRGPVPAPPKIDPEAPVVAPVTGRCELTGHLPDRSGAGLCSSCAARVTARLERDHARAVPVRLPAPTLFEGVA